MVRNLHARLHARCRCGSAGVCHCASSENAPLRVRNDCVAAGVRPDVRDDGRRRSRRRIHRRVASTAATSSTGGSGVGPQSRLSHDGACDRCDRLVDRASHSEGRTVPAFSRPPPRSGIQPGRRQLVSGICTLTASTVAAGEMAGCRPVVLPAHPDGRPRRSGSNAWNGPIDPGFSSESAYPHHLFVLPGARGDVVADRFAERIRS